MVDSNAADTLSMKGAVDGGRYVPGVAPEEPGRRVVSELEAPLVDGRRPLLGGILELNHCPLARGGGVVATAANVFLSTRGGGGEELTRSGMARVCVCQL